MWGACLPPAICCPGSAGCALDRIVEHRRGHQIWQSFQEVPRVMSRGGGRQLSMCLGPLMGSVELTEVDVGLRLPVVSWKSSQMVAV